MGGGRGGEGKTGFESVCTVVREGNRLLYERLRRGEEYFVTYQKRREKTLTHRTMYW